LATWIEDGADATEALTFAQENNLDVSAEQLEAIKEQERLWAEMILKLQGAAIAFATSETVTNAVTKALGWASDALGIAVGLWNQLITIFELVREKVQNADWFDGLISGLEKVADWVKEVGNLVSDSFLGALFGGEDTGNLLGALPGFDVGTPSGSIPGTGPRLGVFHGGEKVQTRAQVLADGDGRGPREVIVNVAGNVYGVEDLNATIDGAMTRYDMGVG